MKPSEFGICPPDDDIALMVAFTRQQRLKEAYQAQVDQETSSKKSAQREAASKAKSKNARRK